jgi:flavin-dependent dehydrogenase
MTAEKKVHIVGAGLSGLVAAICLAREGHEVTVLERAKSIGGLHPHHPSNHSTPVNVELMKGYVGIDITPCLTPQRNMYVHVGGRRYRLSWNCHSVERGPRKTSLDTFLYDLALKAGAAFEFDQVVTNPSDLPDPTILATGLFPEMYKTLNRPFMRLPCFSATRKVTDPERQGEIRTWFGPYTNTYGYAPINNQLDYVLLFSNRDLSEENLKRFEEELERSEGIRFDRWDAFEVFVPMGRPDAPRLFEGGKILAGTLAGMMEPGAYFGIHGALISGKIAARAVSDPEGAARDFKRFNKGYKPSWYRNRWMNNPQKLFLHSLYFRFPALFGPLMRLTDSGIPGLDHFMTGMKPEYVGPY